MGSIYNGRDEYHLLTLNEHLLIKKIILESPEQKEFYFLDIGAGNFQWGRKLCKFLNNQGDLPPDITIHILGIRGEGGIGKRKTQGKCKVYELTAFKVENLFSEFKNQGFDLENKLDLVISSWCFRHLVDPLGTFVQTYNLLRPHQGLLLMDGFFYQDKTGKIIDKDPGDESNAYLVNLLVHSKAPFLLQPYSLQGSLWQFLVKRHNDKPCQLPMSYLGMQACSSRAPIGSLCVTQFDIPDKKYDLTYLSEIKLNSDLIYGDPSLYDQFRFFMHMPIHN